MHNRRTGSFRAAVGALFGLAVVAGCEATPDANAGSGMLAISAPETGAVAVIDVATGERRELVSAGGPYGAITIAPDKRQVAYAREADVGLDRTIFTVDVASGTSRRIAPTTGAHGVSIEWLAAGWFWYVFGFGDSPRTGLVGPGQVDARRLGSNYYVSLEASPVDDRITYSDCYQQVEFGNTFCLVVERLDGSERAVLATQIRGSAPRFSPDGSLIVYTTEMGGKSHVVTQPVLGGQVTDLGPPTISSWPTTSRSPAAAASRRTDPSCSCCVTTRCWRSRWTGRASGSSLTSGRCAPRSARPATWSTS